MDTKSSIQQFLATTSPFSQLPLRSLEQLSQKAQLWRYRMGQAILLSQIMPTHVYVIYQGQVRLMANDVRTQQSVTLKLLEPGATFGWAGILRNLPCETASAAMPTVCLLISAADFMALLEQEPSFAAAFCNRPSLCEVFDILGRELAGRADGMTNLKELSLRAWSNAIVHWCQPSQIGLNQLDPERIWFRSGSYLSISFADEHDSLQKSYKSKFYNSLQPKAEEATLAVKSSGLTRLIGLRQIDLMGEKPVTSNTHLAPLIAWEEVPDAPEQPPTLKNYKQQYPDFRGRGPVDAPLACFQMLSEHLGLPYRRDVIRRILANQSARREKVSLSLCGAIAELIELKATLVDVPAAVFTRLPTPALIHWQERLALLYHIDPKEVVLAVPEEGIRRLKTPRFLEDWGESGQVLLLERTQHTPQKRFNLGWFLPALGRYRSVLFTVLIASFFTQLFSLANPLGIQLIIDKVLVQNSIATLNVLGIFLVTAAIFEALLSSFRTYLFVDTTNRIDIALGSQVIDHLLRVPLRYFERRPVGELATRVNELENIRSFLTGTALTAVLDAIFSVIYIVVMFFYSWLLTLVAFATVPVFALMTLIVSPLIRQQVRSKAERNAETQSYLVEVVSGIQTVKSQNIELKCRWQWQERYTRYVSAGFKSVLTSTIARSTNNFLDKISGLLLLWVGAYLVLQGQLTLGQLIAFRIIASYTTSPLLRLIQLWQNFQETALSLERLGDILNTPEEGEAAGRHNIPMPEIRGAVRYENVSFRFAKSGEPQLVNINLNLAAGTFVGIVGTSGAGKSTLTKLLPRLYELDAGRVLIDGYDIGKVELYSLRRQIGVVLQDTLLFDGTVQENIALTNPDATPEEIVAAAKVACAHEFIMTLPSGYNTRVGERGSALSGGQRQRIAIARTVLQNPRLLVLDEATSALDYNTERQVCQNLAAAFKDRTVLFITHRLATIQHADLIVMMDSGRVVEQGTHPELMDLRGRYYCLYQQQEIDNN